MNILKSLLAAILSFLFISCGNYEKKEKDKLVSNSQFILKDSIVVDYLGNLHITDFNEEKDSYLALDLSSNSIIQFNQEGEILYEPITTGEGPEYIRGTIFSLGYSEDQSLIVQTRTILYELNYEGEILRKIRLPDGNIYTNMRLVNYAFDNNVFLLHDNNTDLRPIYREYFDEVKHITIVDMESELVEFIIPFEEKSMYKNDNYYYRTSIPAFSLNKKDSSINLIYPYEKKIYQYDLVEDYILNKIIDTNPENFKEPEKANFNSEFNTMKSLAYDSYYLNIYNNSEYVVLEYVTGLPYTISAPQSLTALNDLLKDHNNRYYQFFKNGEMVGGDIKQPEGMMDLKYLHENDQVVFQLDKNNAERNYEVFYVYEIDF
jgi:hypothetical protein